MDSKRISTDDETARIETEITLLRLEKKRLEQKYNDLLKLDIVELTSMAIENKVTNIRDERNETWARDMHIAVAADENIQIEQVRKANAALVLQCAALAVQRDAEATQDNEALKKTVDGLIAECDSHKKRTSAAEDRIRELEQRDIAGRKNDADASPTAAGAVGHVEHILASGGAGSPLPKIGGMNAEQARVAERRRLAEEQARTTARYDVGNIDAEIQRLNGAWMQREVQLVVFSPHPPVSNSPEEQPSSSLQRRTRVSSAPPRKPVVPDEHKFTLAEEWGMGDDGPRAASLQQTARYEPKKNNSLFLALLQTGAQILEDEDRKAIGIVEEMRRQQIALAGRMHRQALAAIRQMLNHTQQQETVE